MIASACIAVPAWAFEMEMGSVTINDTFTVPTWTSVSFLDAFDTRPIVLVLPTNQGSDPATVRVRNVTTTGFEVLQVEPNANDGPHVAMNTSYLAIEPGDHVLADGTRIAALEVSTTAFASRFISVTWQGVSFPTPFSAAPALVTQIQTMANETGTPPATSSIPFLDVGVQNLGPASFDVTLERAESIAGLIAYPERIGIVAIDSGTNYTFVDSFNTSVQLQALATPDNITGWGNGCIVNNYPVAFTATPLSVASQTRRDGNNGGWIRRCSESATGLGLTVDEDIDNDSERNHTTEAAGIIAASAAFHANFDVDLTVQKSFTTISDPINGGSGPLSIPQAIIEYRVAVENRGSISPDDSSLTVVDVLPDELAVCVTAACLAGGPVVLDDSGSPVPSGVTIGLVEYSDDGGASYSYSPVPDADGFDPLVNAVRVTLNGTFSSISTSGPPSFELVLAARVE